MQVGDLVWSLSDDIKGSKKRLAIIIALEYDDYNPYFIKLVACGRQGKTSRKYLEPIDRD
mgnify:FL=1